MTTTAWDNDPNENPCHYKGEVCTNCKKGMIDGVYNNCRLTCKSYEAWQVLHDKKVAQDYENRMAYSRLNTFVISNIERTTRKKHRRM